MIEIRNRRQFASAIERARSERMLVKPIRGRAREYTVTNRARGRSYVVMLTLHGGRKFGDCSCEAGSPTRPDAVPMVCKHLAAALIVNAALATRAHVTRH